ncbi:MAG: hypothetical protein J5614_10125 [Paludibacteraceae bacterium]|nr:hypothetical protein [Paludibacteraceae bacterium]
MSKAGKNLPETLTDENVTDVNFFRDDLEEMYKSVDQIDELANKIDDEVNNVYFDPEHRQMAGRGVLTFTTSMIESLTTLRTAKCNSINQILGNKLKISQMTINKNKQETEGASAAAVAKEFNRLFLENSNTITPKNPQADIVERAMSGINKEDDSALEKRINQLEEAGDLRFTDNEYAVRYEKRGVEFCVINTNTNPQFVACAQDNGEILDDYPKTLFPDSKILEIGTLDATGTKFVGGSGKEYKVLS